MKRVAFIGHTFHNRTRSSAFFTDFLGDVFDEIDRFDYDPEDPDKFDYSRLLSQSYSHMVFWQTESILAKIKQVTRSRNIIIPMYDGAIQRPPEYWQAFSTDIFVSFSTTLHRILQTAGCDSVLVQYWPEPAGKAVPTADPLSAFFWERRPGSDYDARSVLATCAKLDITHLHIHLAADYNRDQTQRERAITDIHAAAGYDMTLSFSEWFDTVADFKSEIHRHPVYFAPRVLEGIGMSFLEAMAHGQVVIGPNKPTLNEYIADGANGYLLRPDGTISRRQDQFQPTLADVSSRTLDSVVQGRRRWVQDVDRLKQILVSDSVGFHTDAGQNFERQTRLAAGRRHQAAASGT